MNADGPLGDVIICVRDVALCHFSMYPGTSVYTEVHVFQCEFLGLKWF